MMQRAKKQPRNRCSSSSPTFRTVETLGDSRRRERTTKTFTTLLIESSN
jgi:hypothetical protein